MPIPPATERLCFREWRLDDLEHFYAICSNPNVIKFVGDGQPWSRDKSRLFIESAITAYQSHHYCRWPLIHTATSKLIGFCGFVKTDSSAEIGWRLAADYWGNGFATEAAHAVINFGFEVLGFTAITATVQESNRASIRLIEKLGMIFENNYQRNQSKLLVYSLTNESIDTKRSSN